MTLHQGAIFAGYAIQRVIGVGGMGTVYLARHPRLPMDVALKVLSADLGRDPAARAYFEREAEIAARLQHPNIVRVHDRGTEGDHLWIAMDYVDGPDIGQVLRDGPLAAEVAVEVIAQAADGLDHAHRRGVLHRDVKPANLLTTAVRQRRHVYLTDFGIARSLDDTTTVTTSVRATFAYAAPELLTGHPLDRRADVYALGATLYRLLTDTVPYPRDTLAAVLHAHLHQTPPQATSCRPDLPAGVDRVIATAMAKDPADRYPTCTALAEAAVTALREPATLPAPRPLPASPPLPAPRPLPDSRPLPAPPAVPASPSTDAGQTIAGQTDAGQTNAGQTDAGPAAAATPPPGRPPMDGSWDTPTAPAPPPSREPTEPPVPQAKSPTITRRRLLSALGIAAPVAAVATAVVLLTQEDSSGRSDAPGQRDVPRAGSRLRTVLTGHTGLVHDVRFSPDGALVATASFDKSARLWDVGAGGPVGEPLTGHTDRVRSVAFAPDGATLATTSADTTARLWDVRTGRPLGEPLSDAAGSINAAAFAPDGVLLATAGSDSLIRLRGVDSRQQVGAPLHGHTAAVNAVAFSPDGTILASAGFDMTVRLWDVRARRQLGAPFLGHTDRVRTVIFSPDASLLATTGADGTARIWDTGTHRQLGDAIPGHTGGVRAVAFAPDGATLASGGDDGTVRLWDVTTRRQLGEPLTGHTDAVYAVTFSPDGRLLATTGSDATLRLWEPAV
ncbi:WD40 repeat domain-containing serine/threonine protein kinase [Nocardia otitidiscaviarum]|uniref:WD40 repeat domain-containing serine/threonine protein kinase n=1 Tax=Nocardia otitidiscaviarum TaxID=1823 RepID=UPI001894ED6E|nr:serine/threonine-protein kinase [Nocardia otitidiscaviarum]MBF6180313.1 serine/threonine protein kinase [Nocardia otitidiscaviarum]